MAKVAPYTTKHGTGWRYKRRVPLALVAAVGKTFWVRHLGALNGPQLAAVAHRLASEHDTLIVRLSALHEHELDHIASVGGVDAAVEDAAQRIVALATVKDEAAKVLAAPDDLPGIAGYRERIAQEKTLAELPARFMAPYVEGVTSAAAKVSPEVETPAKIDSLIDSMAEGLASEQREDDA